MIDWLSDVQYVGSGEYVCETVYTCNDGVTLIVEDTGEDLISVPLQDL